MMLVVATTWIGLSEEKDCASSEADREQPEAIDMNPIVSNATTMGVRWECPALYRRIEERIRVDMGKRTEVMSDPLDAIFFTF